MARDDFALARRSQPEDGFERGGLARAVAPEQGGDAAARDAHIHALQDVILADEGVDGLNVEEGVHNFPLFQVTVSFKVTVTWLSDI